MALRVLPGRPSSRNRPRRCRTSRFRGGVFPPDRSVGEACRPGPPSRIPRFQFDQGMPGPEPCPGTRFRRARRCRRSRRPFAWSPSTPAPHRRTLCATCTSFWAGCGTPPHRRPVERRRQPIGSGSRRSRRPPPRSAAFSCRWARRPLRWAGRRRDRRATRGAARDRPGTACRPGESEHRSQTLLGRTAPRRSRSQSTFRDG